MNGRRHSSPLNDYPLRAADAVVHNFGSDAEYGLTGTEVPRRLAEYGRNELRAVAPIPTGRRVLAQFQDPLVYLLLGAIIIAMVVVANAVLGFVQEARAANAVAALARMTAVTSSVLRDGEKAHSER
ncbi:cation-transporting P-type ATPase [Mesorhizobium sp. SB112]|uniref:cation-transporting P-type ATPase n=1 Tax=Mesorhizobium sp. SB112 TaxID=3151853 RepID=UPI003267AAFD